MPGQADAARRKRPPGTQLSTWRAVLDRAIGHRSGRKDGFERLGGIASCGVPKSPAVRAVEQVTGRLAMAGGDSRACYCGKQREGGRAWLLLAMCSCGPTWREAGPTGWRRFVPRAMPWR